MGYIKSIKIDKISQSNYLISIKVDGLKPEQKIIIKSDFHYYFTTKTGSNQFTTSLLFSPILGLETNLRIYVYNYLLDSIEEIRHEFIDFSAFFQTQMLDATYMMVGSDILNREWCGSLKATKIEGPFQNGKKVKSIDPKQIVTFHAYHNELKANEVQLLSMKWKLITANKQEKNLRKAKGFTINTQKDYVAVSFYLEEQTDFTLFANFSSFTEAKLNYTTVKNEAPIKTKVHFTIGMFFDGTGNNRFNSDKVYYKNLDKNNLVNEKALKEKLKLTGTKSTFEVATDSSYWNPYSNVALLYDLYKTKNEKRDDFNIDVTLKQYVQGIGTFDGEQDNTAGFALGEGTEGIIGKVWEGCYKLALQLKDILDNNNEIGSITFDVFGFSRGAAAARHFCNEVIAKESIETLFEQLPPIEGDKKMVEVDNTATGKKQKIFKPIGFQYTLGLFGLALKELNLQNKINHYDEHLISDAKNEKEILKEIEKHKENSVKNAPVKIRFVGLFDTVISQMVIKNHFGKKLDVVNILTPSPIKLPPYIGSLSELKLNKVKQKIEHLPIKQIVHLMANDEYRENFASTKVGNGRHIFEISLSGAHSDLGGGYAAMKIDVDIVDYDYIIHQTTELPIPERLLSLKNFLIGKGYCLPGEIVIKAIKTFNYTTRVAVAYQTLFQLIVTRNITPRYSIVNLNVMKELAEINGIVFEESNVKYKFEYKIPEELVDYEKELKENIKGKFKGEFNKSMKKKLFKNKFIHLSSNYNKSKGIERYGAAITGNKNIDKIFYVNAPRYTNSKQESYERETYTHPQ